MNSCLKLHTDYLCPNFRLTASTNVLCTAVVFQSTPDDNLICSLCEFTYYKYFTPPPAALETQDEILLVNLPPKWQLVCDNQIDRPIPLNSAIYAVVNKNDLCTCGISAQHVFLYESICTCTTPDASVTLYYIHNRALLAYDTSLCKKDKEAEQYHTTIPEYQAPNISYKKKSVDVSQTSSKRTRKCRNTSMKQDNDRNVTVDDLLSLSFPLSEAVDFMETGKTSYIPSTQPVCKQPVNFPIPLIQDMDFYFNIVTVINFLTSIINAIVLAVCYRKCKDLLSGILTVAMETMTNNKGTQLSDNEFTTENPVTKVTLSTQQYSFLFNTVDISYCIIVYAYNLYIILDIHIDCLTIDKKVKYL